jgi:hypothetical protein
VSFTLLEYYTLHPEYIVQTTLWLLGGDVLNCTQLPQKPTKALGYKKKASKDGVLPLMLS